MTRIATALGMEVIAVDNNSTAAVRHHIESRCDEVPNSCYVFEPRPDAPAQERTGAKDASPTVEH